MAEPSVICPSIFHKLSMLPKMYQKILQLFQMSLRISKKEIYCHIPLNFLNILFLVPAVTTINIAHDIYKKIQNWKK